MEGKITKYYLIQTSGKVLKHLDVFEIVSFLESGELDGQSYVFDLRIREWILVKDIRVLKDTQYQFLDSDSRECPTFTPPHKLAVGDLGDGKDSDYEYLLQYMLRISESKNISPVKDNQTTEELLDAMLEKTQADLEKKESEISGLSYINSEFEEHISELKNENKKLNDSLIKVENESIDYLNEIKKIKQFAEQDIKSLKLSFADKIDKLAHSEKQIIKLTERNKALIYALKLERAQSESFKILLTQKEVSSTKKSHNEELLEKTFNYLLNGPVGSGKDLLEKKVDLLTRELSELESFYTIKIEKIKDHYKKIYSCHIEDIGKEKNKLSSLSSQKDKYQKEYKNLLSVNKELSLELMNMKNRLCSSNEDNSYKDKYLDLISKYEKIANSEKLKEIPAEDESVKYLKNELISARKEIVSLKEQVNSLLLERDSLQDQNLDSCKEDQKLNSLITNLRSDNKQLISKFNSLRERTSKYKVAYNELSDKYKLLKSDHKKRSHQLSKLKNETDKIIDSLKGKVDGANSVYTEQLKELEDVKNREKTLMLKIEDFQSLDVSEEDEESISLASGEDKEKLTRLIGDAFEVTNDCIWKTLKDNEESGPYCFSEIYKMKINGELDSNIKIKKGNDPFKVKGDIFELSAPVTTHGTGENVRYFINRDSMRVPFYELITFEIGGVEYKGYCSSLSIGGVFLEFTSLSENFVLDKKGRVLFSVGAIDNPFQCVAQIKNISESRPKGLGLMFIDLPEQARTDIQFYINNYINKTQKAA